MIEPIVTLVTAPSTYPVSLDEVKEHCQATEFDDDDSLLTRLRNRAVDHLDYAIGGVLGQAICTQSWSVEVPYQSYRKEDGIEFIELPVPPVQSVTSIEYYDPDNAQQTATLAEYQLITRGNRSYVKVLPDYSWPSVYDREDAIKVTFVTGFATVPENIKGAILFLVYHWYENRDTVVVGSDTYPIPATFDALIEPMIPRRYF